MVVKSELKLIKSLQQKKYRNEHGLFVVEGKKTLEELLDASVAPYKLYATDSSELSLANTKVARISDRELRQISSLKNPNGFLGVFHIPKEMATVETDWILMLDGVQDPGNLGTIIRLCDWFGISSVICSLDTVDCYNSKVLQATMGSIARVQVHYESLESFLEHTKLPVYGTFMDGISVQAQHLPEKGIMVMGNEGKGISDAIAKHCTHRLAIPQYEKATTESLNVATATAILLHEIRR